MTASFQRNDPVPELLDQLIDGLYLLYECRRRGVGNVDRLLEYIEFIMDEIERHRLGMSSDLFLTMIEQDPSEALCTRSVS